MYKHGNRLRGSKMFSSRGNQSISKQDFCGKKCYIVKIEYFFKVIYFSCSLDDGKNILTYFIRWLNIFYRSTGTFQNGIF